jgi:hypothetical protein
MKLLSLKISCSNIGEPTSDELDEFNKPLTERTPRWVGTENPQEEETSQEKTQ